MPNATLTKPENKASNKSKSMGDESMIVKLGNLDKMLELAGQVIIVSSNLNALGRQIHQGSTISRNVADDVKDLAITSSRISSDLHSLVSDVRTVGMGDLFARFRRLARDTSRRLGKAIKFEVEGEGINIDKKISEKIYDPIAHQIRNAIDHGIESSQRRIELGKDPVGKVCVRVRNLENSTVIEVTDDGSGIDDEAVRKRIVDSGLGDAKTAGGLSGAGLYEYLYLPGFSTSATTSQTSGRGVGMDVINAVMTEIGGETSILNSPGKGMTFTFTLPMVTAVNISDSLLVRAGEMVFAFPILSVIASQSISADQITTTTGRGKSILYLGSILPLFDLLKVFGEAGVESGDGEKRVIIVENKQRRLAFLVSDFQSPQKIVISEFDKGMQVKGLSGTALLSGRKIGLVIDLPALFELTLGKETLSAGMNKQSEMAMFDLAETNDLNEPIGTERGEEKREAIGTGEGLNGQADSAFLTEVESMLSRLNKELLELDEHRSSESADSVFRLMHSIKGNLTMYGAERGATVAHSLETILERGREHVQALSDDVFDVLFDGSSYLEEIVTALTQGGGEVDMSEKLAAGIEQFCNVAETSDGAAAAAIGDGQIVLDSTGEFYLSSRRRDGVNLYQSRITFEPGDQPAFLVAYLILRRIQRSADVIGTYPAMIDIEAGLCDGNLSVLMAPRGEGSNAMDALEGNLKQYYGVKNFDAAAYA